MPVFEDLQEIDGVKLVHLQPYPDERGRFMETFRNEWFPVSWERLQANRSDSRMGVLRGMHFHHQQVDYWLPHKGVLWVALADVRIGSPTQGAVTMFYMNAQNNIGLFIPT